MLLDRTRSDGADWAYPRGDGLEVRAAAQADAAVIETLGLHFVRVLGAERQSTGHRRPGAAWTEIATPGGRTGFVPPGSLLAAAPARLCYVKDITGRWRISGYVAGGE